MKIAVVTMVYRDYWALARWYRHFGGMVDPKHLYVVAHGEDAEIARICPDANVMVIPRGDFRHFDRKRWRFLNRLQDALAVMYDHVIRTDADELICLDPGQFGSLEDVFRANTAPALFALGLDIVEQDGHWAIFNGHYSKAWTVQPRLPMVLHGIRGNIEFVMPKGVYLVHLKYANTEALSQSNAHRVEIANAEGRGLPGKAWSAADKKADELLERVASLAEVSWDDAVAEAYDALAHAPKRVDGITRAQFLKFNHKSRPPGWIF